MRAEQDAILRLLKTARGQLDGIIKMVEQDRYCIDISTQLMACEKVLSRTNKEVLLAHIRGCVQDAVKEGDEKKIEEIAIFLQKLL